MSISILFLSSAEIAQPLFEHLCDNEKFNVVGLICQPDKAAGRGQKIKSSKAKLYAESKAVPVFQPERLSSDTELLEKFQDAAPDFLITFAYGQILSEEWLNIPKLDALNVHTSLLPKYRGASPIQAALLNGDPKSGLTLMRMVKKMDAGPIFSQKEIDILPRHTAGKLHDEFAQLAAQWVPEELHRIINAELSAEEQIDVHVSYCHKIQREDAQLDFNSSAETNFRMWQAYTPWPSIWTKWKGKTIKIHDCLLSSIKLDTGKIEWINSKLYLGFKDGSLELKQIQIEGKRPMNPKDFLNGNADFLSAQLPS